MSIPHIQHLVLAFSLLYEHCSVLYFGIPQTPTAEINACAYRYLRQQRLEHHLRSRLDLAVIVVISMFDYLMFVCTFQVTLLIITANMTFLSYRTPPAMLASWQ